MVDDWQFYILFLLLVLISYLFFVFERALFQMFRTTMNLNLSEECFRNNELSSSIFGAIMQSVFVLSVAYFSYWYISEYSLFDNLESWVIYSLCIVFFVLLYIIKNVFLWGISLIFPFGQDVSFYRFNLNVHNQVLGIVLVPFLFLLTYSYSGVKEYVVWFILFLIVVTLLFRYAKLFMIAFKYIRFYKFYFFIYFCTSEMIPNLVLIKILYSL